jgi:hypothetical protein
MKHLKRFNEELNSSTYMRASRKLQKIVKDDPRLARSINAAERADKLKSHAGDMEMRESIDKWKRKVDKYSKFGTFRFDLYSPGSEDSYRGGNVEFYLEICPEFTDLQEFWDEEEQDNRTISIRFSVGLIPTSEDDIKGISDNFEDLDFYNGFFWGFWFSVDYTVVNCKTSFSKIQLDSYDDSVAEIQISGMKTRQQLKKIFMDIFEQNSDLNKSSTDNSNLYELVETEVIQGLELYSDYGIDQDRIVTDLRKIPASHILIR